MLYKIAVERIIREMDGGLELCQTLKASLERVYRAHIYSMLQRRASGIRIEWGDGWQETRDKLIKERYDAEQECRNARASAANGLDNMKPWAHKSEILKCLRRALDQSTAATTVHHMP